MRSRKSSQEQLAEVARRRLELLSAELAEIRPDHRPEHPEARTVERAPDGAGGAEPTEGRGGSGEPRRPTPATSGAGRHAHRSVGAPGMASGWIRDRLPPSVQGGVGLSAAHLAVVACVLVAGLLVTLWWLARARDEGTEVPAVGSPRSAPPSALVVLPSSAPTSSPTAGGQGSASGTPSAASGASAPGTSAAGASPPTPSGSVVVDVAGKVRRPGIATLPLGSRVVDAVEAAGGARRGVRLGSLNLARLLTDGEQIVVGVPAPAGVAASAAAAPTSSGGASGAAVPLVNINTADQAELEELPGIGPVTAQSILAFRSERGTFTSVDELLEVSGIGDATLAEIAPHVTL